MKERRLDRLNGAESLATQGLDIYNLARFAIGPREHTLIVGAEYYRDDYRGALNGARKPAVPDGEGSV